MKCIDFYLKEDNLKETEFEGYYSIIFKEDNKIKLDSFYNLDFSYKNQKIFFLDLFFFKVKTDLENEHQKFIKI